MALKNVLNNSQELTDIEILNESEEGAKLLIDELLNGQIVETLVQQALVKLNEKEQDESDAVQNILSIIENVRFL
jgi:beta-catenin-like protein 1